jgi:hypothetical protein
MLAEMTRRTYDDLLALAEQCQPYSIDGKLCRPNGMAGPFGIAGQQPVSADDAALPLDGQLVPDGLDPTVAIEQHILGMIKIDVLGELENGNVKVFAEYHRKTFRIADASRLSYETLLQICGPSVKNHVLKGAAKGNSDGMHQMSEVRDAIALLSGYKRIGEQTELGAGCWWGAAASGESDSSVVVVGSSEAAEWNSEKKLSRIVHPRCRGHLLDFDSGDKRWYDFDTLAAYLDQCDKDFAVEATNQTIELFQKWTWKTKSGPAVATGLVLATWIQTLWRWRPQVAVIGPTQAGKSTFFAALSGIFGNLAIGNTGSTAAGLRQAIGSSSKVVLSDEFENSRHRAEVLEMLRASGDGTKMLRGSTNQKGVSFDLKHIVWVAAIESGLKREPDRNRFITLELTRPAKSAFGKLKLPSRSELADLGQRLLAIAIRRAGEAVLLAEQLKEESFGDIDTRVVEGFAAPAAILSIASGYSHAQARELLAAMLADVEQHEPNETSDEADLLRFILSSQITVDRGAPQAASQLLETVIEQKRGMEEAETALEKSGIRYLAHKRALFLAYDVVSRHLLRGSVWDGQVIHQVLRRLAGVTKSRQRIAGGFAQGLEIPRLILDRDFLGQPDSGHVPIEQVEQSVNSE